MICPVKLVNEMFDLSGALVSALTRCGHEANEHRRQRSKKVDLVNCASPGRGTHWDFAAALWESLKPFQDPQGPWWELLAYF